MLILLAPRAVGQVLTAYLCESAAMTSSLQFTICLAKVYTLQCITSEVSMYVF